MSFLSGLQGRSLPVPPAFWIFVCVTVLIFLIAVFVKFLIHKKLTKLLVEVSSYIQKPGFTSKPLELSELETTYKNSSTYLDNVNTIVILEKFYSKLRVKFFFTSFSFDSGEGFCRIAPNLLIALGLIGTFLGISLNLYHINQVLVPAQANSLSNVPVEELEKPLAAMGLAFGTSLIGLISSFILSLLYTFKNTILLRERFFFITEDYLDNTFQTTVEGNTRLDKLIKNMSEQFKDFLTNFGYTVRQSVEEAVKDNFDKVSEANLVLSHQATELYNRFSQSSSTMANSADQFRQSAEVFSKSQFANVLSKATTDLLLGQVKFSESLTLLKETVRETQNLSSSVESLGQQILGLIQTNTYLNEKNAQILDTSIQNQVDLSAVIPQLKEGASSFGKAANKLDRVRQKLDEKESYLSLVEAELKSLVAENSKFHDNIVVTLSELRTTASTSLTQTTNAINVASDRQAEYFNGYAKLALESVANTLDSLNSVCRKIDILISANHSLKDEFANITADNRSQLVEQLILCKNQIVSLNDEVAIFRKSFDILRQTNGTKL